jgi:hypothetical protein
MHVCVENRRHHRLAGKVDPRCAFGYLHFTSASHLHELGIANDDDRVLYGCAAVADDHPRSFEHRRRRASRCLGRFRRLSTRGHQRGHGQQSRKDDREA